MNFRFSFSSKLIICWAHVFDSATWSRKLLMTMSWYHLYIDSNIILPNIYSFWSWLQECVGIIKLWTINIHRVLISIITPWFSVIGVFFYDVHDYNDMKHMERGHCNHNHIKPNFCCNLIIPYLERLYKITTATKILRL